MQYRLRHVLVILASLLTAGPLCEHASFAELQTPRESNAGARAQADVKVFDEVWSRVRDSFYDPKFHGLNWKAIGEEYRLRLGEPGADLARVINLMLAELGASHTGYYTPAEAAYYDLADIFAGGLREDLPKHFAEGEVAYTGIGMTGGGPGTATTLLSFQIWKESFSMYDFGAGSAVAFIIVAISALLIVAITRALPSDLFGDG